MEPRPLLPRLPLLLLALLPSCGRPTVPPLHPNIELDVRVIGDATTLTKQRCAARVTAILHGHGFVTDERGTMVDVEVVMERDNLDALMRTPEGAQDHRYHAEPRVTAAISARIHGEGQALRSTGSSQTDSCAVAAERLASPLQSALDAPSPQRTLSSPSRSPTD
jgi:hypothetical protein